MALIECAECGREISDRAEACPACGCPVEQEDGYSESYVETYRTKTHTSSAGGGCLVQLLGLGILFCSFFIFPVLGLIPGLIIFVILFFVGSSMSKWPVCSNCGTRLSSHNVKSCPGCSGTLVNGSYGGAGVKLAVLVAVGMGIWYASGSLTGVDSYSGKIDEARAQRQVEEKTEEQQLYAEVKAIPARDIFANIRGYLKLKAVAPYNSTYEAKFQHYSDLAQTRIDEWAARLKTDAEPNIIDAHAPGYATVWVKFVPKKYGSSFRGSADYLWMDYLERVGGDSLQVVVKDWKSDSLETVERFHFKK